MLYTFSASCNGDFESIELTIHDCVPFVKVEPSKLTSEARSIAEAWLHFINIVEVLPK
jgi:hypothetical protein